MTEAVGPLPQQDQPTVISVPIEPAPKQQQPEVETGDWKYGAFDCCNECYPRTMIAWWLPCISLGQISHRVGVASFTFVATFFGLFFAIECFFDINVFYANATGRVLIRSKIVYKYYNIITLVVAVAFALFIWHLRNHIRQRYNIEGSACSDCLLACCCQCCALAQMASQVDLYESGECALGPPDQLDQTV